MLGLKSGYGWTVFYRCPESGLWVQQYEGYHLLEKVQKTTRFLKIFRHVRTFFLSDNKWVEKRKEMVTLGKKLLTVYNDVKVCQQHRVFLQESSLYPEGHYYFDDIVTIWKNGEFVD